MSAVAYRRAMLRILAAHAQVQLASWMDDGEPNQALFRAAAQVPMEWIGGNVEREALPFDMDEFWRRARGELTS